MERTTDDKSESVASSILERVKVNDPEAWQLLVRMFGPVVYLWSRQSGVPEADAADVVQEVLVAVLTNIQSFRRDRAGDSFRGWLWTITKNKVRDHFRRHQTQPRGQGGTDALQRLAQLPEQPPESSADAAGSADDESGLEHRALELAIRSGFEDRTWEAFWQTTVQGRRAADVADELGMSAAAVYKAKSRVMRRIRQSIGELVE